MKRKKFLLLTLVFFLFLGLKFDTVKAHEFSPPLRWYDVRYDSGRGHNYAYLLVNTDYINGEYFTAALDSMTNWNNNSNNRARLVYSSFSSSKVDLSTGWPTDFPISWYGVNVSSTSNNKITYSAIYLNLYTTTSWNLNDKRHNVAHELGHSLGLYETNDGTVSVMRQGRGSTFGYWNYWIPSTHDKNDVTAYYQ